MKLGNSHETVSASSKERQAPPPPGPGPSIGSGRKGLGRRERDVGAAECPRGERQA